MFGGAQPPAQEVKPEPKREAPQPPPLPPKIEKTVKPAPAKTNSQGVVKGPKVMPAVKKQGVETEILFAPNDDKQVTLIDRAQPKQPTIKE